MAQRDIDVDVLVLRTSGCGIAAARASVARIAAFVAAVHRVV